MSGSHQIKPGDSVSIKGLLGRAVHVSGKEIAVEMAGAEGACPHVFDAKDVRIWPEDDQSNIWARTGTDRPPPRYSESWGVYDRPRYDVPKVAHSTNSVDHPDHYGGDNNPYETITVLREWDLVAARGFCWGNAIKYLSRAGKKPGVSALQDYEKAAWYCRELADIQQELEESGRTDNS